LKNVLLVISGSVAAYKALELIRLLRGDGVNVNAILTQGGAEFITPLAVSSLTGNPTYSDLFSLKDEVEMGHIQLSRLADAIIVAPASADIMAKMAAGIADNLATATLLASDKPIFVAPAMNKYMWEHPATRRNIAQLQADGVEIIFPQEGELACGEIGSGRMAEPLEIKNQLFPAQKLKNKKILITSGGTQEPIDPVRYIGNRSSGLQGWQIAKVFAQAGAEVTLISAPTNLPLLPNVCQINVQTAQEMFAATINSLPVDIAIFAAAVADWRPEMAATNKIKKRDNATAPNIKLSETPDILAYVAKHPSQRPDLVIGFAAESENLLENARQKLLRKGCDWLLANDISEGKIFGELETEILFLTADGEEKFPRMRKIEVAEKLLERLTSPSPSGRGTG